MIIYGVRNRSKAAWQAPAPCRQCGAATVHTGIQSRRWLTLFFIPVIPLWQRRRLYCNRCGLATKPTRAEWEALRRQQIALS
jgi:ribosomal protein L37E